MSNKGVSIESREPVERLSSEGPLDQNLTVAVDDSERETIFLDGVKDEADLFERCPALGIVDCAKGPAGKSIEQCLSDLPGFLDHMLLEPNGETRLSYLDGARRDRYSVQNIEWLEKPEQLVWRSALLAQLKAKHNAVTYYLNDPSAADFAGSLTDEQRKALGQRARQVAELLRSSALREISDNCRQAEEQYRQAVIRTKGRFLRHVVTREDAIRQGGLTESDVNELFEEV